MQVIWNAQIDGIDMHLKAYDYYCATEIFTINGVDATTSDFGESEGLSPWDAPKYGCGNRTFIPYEHPTSDVLKKYDITKEQFANIVDELATVLSFGCCGLCA